MWTLYFYGIRFRVTKKFTLQKIGFNKQKNSGHAEYFLIFVLKKSIFLREGGRHPHPDMSPKKSSFFDALPKLNSKSPIMFPCRA